MDSWRNQVVPALIACAILGWATPARAASKPPQVGGFSFDLEVVVAGSPEAAFDAFTLETKEWWDHHMSASPKELRFEPWPGGRFLEVFDDTGNGARHGEVIFAERGKRLRFTGPLGLSGHAIDLVCTLDFEPAEKGTKVKLEVRAAGEVQEGWAATVEQVWRHFLVERFEPYMASRKTPARAGPAATVDRLGWLAGCWQGDSGERRYREQWMKPEGGTMLGMSRTVSGGKTVEHEFVEIREQDGAVFYVAKPSGQEGDSFRLVESGEGTAVFENPEHDFPQRILYRLEADGRLAAAIEGTQGGKTRRVDFPMRRVPCD